MCRCVSGDVVNFINLFFSVSLVPLGVCYISQVIVGKVNWSALVECVRQVRAWSKLSSGLGWTVTRPI